MDMTKFSFILNWFDQKCQIIITNIDVQYCAFKLYSSSLEYFIAQ